MFGFLNRCGLQLSKKCYWDGWEKQNEMIVCCMCHRFWKINLRTMCLGEASCDCDVIVYTNNAFDSMIVLWNCSDGNVLKVCLAESDLGLIRCQGK